jgi:hypothetical protein
MQCFEQIHLISCRLRVSRSHVCGTLRKYGDNERENRSWDFDGITRVHLPRIRQKYFLECRVYACVCMYLSINSM